MDASAIRGTPLAYRYRNTASEMLTVIAIASLSYFYIHSN